MIKLNPYSLVWRTIPVIAVVLLLTSYLFINRNEKLIEEALLEQAKQQAVVYLNGIRAHIEQERGLQKEQLQELLVRQIKDHSDVLNFAIYKMYIFDRDGNVLSHSDGLPQSAKEVAGKYDGVFDQGQMRLGDRIEEKKIPGSNRVIKKIDVIIPLTLNAERLALEVEIDLEETYKIINSMDDAYEEEFLLITVGAITATIFLIWWVLNRSVLAPLHKVVGVTREIADGKLSGRVQHVSRSELGDLSLAIDTMADSIERLFNEQEQAHLQMLKALAKALEAKDSYTAGHSGRVSKYSVMLGKRIGLEPEELQLLKKGALMHDIGKIGIADKILNKPAPLNEDEIEVMKRHPEMTAAIMKPLSRFKAFAEIAAWHHERWDGAGYPDGLKGEEVPLLARIVGIADTWDAMTGDRVYRRGMPIEKALSILKDEVDSGQWDPQLIRVFIEMMEEQESNRKTVLKDMGKLSGDAV